VRQFLPPLNALRSFDAAARHQSFTRAAEELCVTQGAVSHQVKALEAELGMKLFNRERKGLVITEAGLDYLAVVQDAFDRIALGTDRLLRRQRSGVMTVTTSPDFAAKWLVGRLGRFAELCPDIDLAFPRRCTMSISPGTLRISRSATGQVTGRASTPSIWVLKSSFRSVAQVSLPAAKASGNPKMFYNFLYSILTTGAIGLGGSHRPGHPAKGSCTGRSSTMQACSSTPRLTVREWRWLAPRWRPPTSSKVAWCARSAPLCDCPTHTGSFVQERRARSQR
jgi:Bacterial regulatory helix-turn-helix protein, lysR family